MRSSELTSPNCGFSSTYQIRQATSQGVASVSTPDATRTSLQSDFNNVLTQIDALAADSSYNGINLLNGDSLKVVFNEKNTSSLSISGVTYNSAGLGVSASSNSFQTPWRLAGWSPGRLLAMSR